MSNAAERTAWVTGGGAGFGREIALGLADTGFDVAVIGAAESEDATAGELASLGVRSAGIPSDLNSRDAAIAAFEAASTALGPAHLIVHASIGAAALDESDLHQLDAAGFDGACEAEIRVALFCLQAAHAALRDTGGRIVLVTPTLALIGSARRVAWSTACEAQRAMVKGAARQWGEAGITVNCVAPSVDAVLRAERPGESSENRVLAGAPLGRTGEARADVAPVIALLARPEASFLTGQTLRADGGSWLAG